MSRRPSLPIVIMVGSFLGWWTAPAATICSCIAPSLGAQKRGRNGRLPGTMFAVFADDCSLFRFFDFPVLEKQGMTAKPKIPFSFAEKCSRWSRHFLKILCCFPCYQGICQPRRVGNSVSSASHPVLVGRQPDMRMSRGDSGAVQKCEFYDPRFSRSGFPCFALKFGHGAAAGAWRPGSRARDIGGWQRADFGKF